MAEAGVHTQLLKAFQKLDGNGSKAIDRQEFAGVHVDDGSQSAQAGQTRPLPSRSIEESYQIPRQNPQNR